MVHQFYPYTLKQLPGVVAFRITLILFFLSWGWTATAQRLGPLGTKVLILQKSKTKAVAPFIRSGEGGGGGGGSGGGGGVVCIVANFNVSGGGPLCDGASVNPIRLSGSVSGATYQLYLNNVNTGVSVTGTGAAISFPAQSTVGVYTVNAVQGSCQAMMSGSASVTNTPESYTLTWLSSVNPNDCSNPNGSLTFLTNLPDGSNYRFEFKNESSGSGLNMPITVSGGKFTISNLEPGTYNSFRVRLSNCAFTPELDTPKTLVQSINNLTVGLATNPTGCRNDGQIAFITNLPNGSYSLNYQFNANATSRPVTVASGAFVLNSLPAGEYSNFSITANGCTLTDAATRSLRNPVNSFTYQSKIDATTCNPANGSIRFSTDLPNGTYPITFGSQTNNVTYSRQVTVSGGSFTVGSLGQGSYTSFALANTNDCLITNNTVVPLTMPVYTLSPTGASSATRCNPADGSIQFNTNLPDGSYSFSYSSLGTNYVTASVVGGSFTINNLRPGSYANVRVFPTNGCNASWSGTQEVNAPPNYTLSIGNTTNLSSCGGANGAIGFTTNLPNNTYTLNYQKDGTAVSSTVVVNAGGFSLGSLRTGTYGAFGITQANGCVSTAAGSRTLSAPDFSIESGAASVVVCAGGELMLQVLGGAGWTWSGPGGFSSNAQNPTRTAAANTAGMYSVTARNSNGQCSASTTVQVIVQLLNPSIAGGGLLCAGSTLRLSASGGTQYAWQGPSGFVSNLQNPTRGGLSPAMSGVYSLTISQGNCSTRLTTSALITPNVAPSITSLSFNGQQPNAQNTVSICNGQALTLQVAATNAVEYNWRGPSGAGSGFVSSLVSPVNFSIDNPKQGQYTVSVRNGCTVLNQRVINLQLLNCAQSRIASADDASELDMQLTAYPNPVSKTLRVEVTLKAAKPLSLTLVNSMGQAQGTWYLSEAQTHHSAEIDLQALSGGVYFLEAQTGKERDVKRIVKLAF